MQPLGRDTERGADGKKREKERQAGADALPVIDPSRNRIIVARPSGRR
jgi:hypothetical protein